jgi:histidine triad (HIT) family protein
MEIIYILKGKLTMTLFSQMVSGKISIEKLYEDEDTIVINDLYPQAPIHILVIPKKEIKDFNAVDEKILGCCLKTIQYMVEKLNIKDTGYRVITNTGNDGGQSIPHLHFHILGGTRLTHKLN